MDVFRVHQQVIADYRAFISGFAEVRDARIKRFIEEQVKKGVRWPDSRVALDPFLASGGSAPALVADSSLGPGASLTVSRKSGPLANRMAGFVRTERQS